MLLSSNAGTIHLPAFDDIVPLYIRNVRDKLNESTALFIQIGFKVKCICCEESHHTIQARFKNQQISDLTFDTTGCVFLSYLSPEQREAYMNLTEREVEELRCVLDTGYCIHYNSDLEGTSAVSVPVMLSQDNMIAVLTVKGPAFRFNETMGPSEIAELIKTAKEISDNYSNSIL